MENPLNRNIKTVAQKKLETLQSQSKNALNLVITTVNQLETVNAEIDTVVADIEAQKNSLDTTQASLRDTQISNNRIINNFKALIER